MLERSLAVLRTGLLVGLGLFVLAGNAQAKTVLISGANSGLGIEFAKQYSTLGWQVIATHRRDEIPKSLADLSAARDNVRVERMDITKHDEIDALAAKLAVVPIDVLINNAGMTGDFRQREPQSFGTLDYAQFNTFMWTNALGALKVTEAFTPHVKASEGKKIVAISSLAGSFGAGGGGMPGGYWYKVSKAALNLFMTNVARELQAEGVAVALLSPGEVRVEKMAGSNNPRLIEPDVSISGMIDVIDTLSVETSGSFVRYNGEPQPF
jgi:NAD(P)-dependent dehydrogenase (short-subunit alcohol dehydrogenase family)